MTSNDKRFGGISALALDRGRLLAVTDSGVVIRFSRPAGQGAQAKSASTARIGELPAGPGVGLYKHNRDSELLVQDDDGRGWWVAFENRHSLWLYDHEFAGPVSRFRCAATAGGHNAGSRARLWTAVRFCSPTGG